MIELLNSAHMVMPESNTASLAYSQIYINGVWWARSNNLNLKLYDSLPPGPLTNTTFAKPAMVLRGVDMSVAANTLYTMCYLQIQPRSAADNAAPPATTETLPSAPAASTTAVASSTPAESGSGGGGGSSSSSSSSSSPAFVSSGDSGGGGGGGTAGSSTSTVSTTAATAGARSSSTPSTGSSNSTPAVGNNSSSRVTTVSSSNSPVVTSSSNTLAVGSRSSSTQAAFRSSSSTAAGTGSASADPARSTTAAGPGLAANTTLAPSACPAPADVVCRIHPMKASNSALVANFSCGGLVSVSLLWDNPAARPSAASMMASGAWAGAGLSMVDGGVRSSCLVLDEPASPGPAGFLTRRLVCGSSGRRAVVLLPAVARAAASAGVLVEMCAARSAKATANVALSVQVVQ
jgi:hypothetical protein